MTSSSAYSNVLLKPSVQSQPAAAPKRDYQDDFSNADFSQTFKDVRETERDEKVAKPVAKKAAPVQDRQKPNEVVRDKKPHEVVDKPETENVAADKKDISDDTTVDNKDSEKSDDPVDPSTLAQANCPQPVVAEPVASSELKVGLTGLVVDAEKSTEAVAADGVAATSDESVTKSQNLEGNAVALTPNADSVTSVLSSSEITDTSKLTKETTTTDADTTGEATSIPVTAATDLQQSAAQQIAGDSAAEQAAQQSAAALTNAATAIKSPATADIATAVIDTAEDALSAVVVELSPEKAVSKTAATDTNAIVTSEPDAGVTSFQTSDSKSVFEKMLQTVARSSAPAQDDKTTATPAQNTPNTSSTALDSLARFSDTQTPAARSFVAQTAVPVPVGQPQWSQAVGEKVLWLAAQNISSAEINLHPKDLGPMQVRVSVNQEQTTVSFTSHHPVVREVLDQNLNRLRDMFSEQGLNLVNVDVSDKSFSRQQSDAKDQKGQGGANNATPEEETLVAVSNIVQHRLVDHYA